LDLPLEFRQPADKWRAGAIPDATAGKARIGGELSKEEVLELLETSDRGSGSRTRAYAKYCQ